MIAKTVKTLIPRPLKRAIKYVRAARNNRRLLDAAISRGDLKLHLACGPKILPGWLNVDGAPIAGAMTMAMPAGLRIFPSQSASFVYCSHVLHYFEYPDQVLEFVRQVHRILRPAGVFRVVVPGIERIIRAYAANDAAFFKEQARHHPADCTTKLEHLMCALQARNSDGVHKYGYDFETAKKLMERAGFRRVVDSAFNESEFETLRMDYRGKGLSLFLDAVK